MRRASERDPVSEDVRTAAVGRAAPSAGRARDLPAGVLRGGGFTLVLLTAVAAGAWLWFEAAVLEGFRAVRDTAPSRTYAATASLREGEAADAARVEAHLAAAGYDSAPAPSGGDGAVPPAGTYRLDEGVWSLGLRGFRLDGLYRPPRVVLASVEDGRIERLRVRGPDGREERRSEILLEPIHLETLLGSAPAARLPVPLEEIPDAVVQAVLAIEDRRFHRHPGLDPQRTVGALIANVRAGRAAEGGSTLTQQLSRSLFLTRERTLTRKVAEAAIALALERRISKREILEAYLNHIYLGQDARGVAIRGMGRASVVYFGEDVSRLDVPEAALLAALIRAPSLYDPRRRPPLARERRDLVLRAMGRAGYLEEQELRVALASPLDVTAPTEASRPAPYFADHLEEEVRRHAPGLDLGRAGLTVVGTLEPRLQAIAERVVAEGLAELERSYPYQVGPAGARAAGAVATAPEAGGALQAALVAIEPRTGAILALVGGRDYGVSQFNRVAAARRQPGSVFKPVVALAALEFAAAEGEGPAYTLSSVFRDAPLTVDTDEGPWSPRNYDDEFRGPVTLRTALVASRNVPFVRLGLEVGPERVVDVARRLGIRSDLRPVPSLALGSSEVTLLEMTSAYAVLAAGGVRAPPRAIRRIGDGPEDLPLGDARAPRRVLDAEHARALTAALQRVVDRGTGREVREHGYLGPVAAKSGTTDRFRDAWFVGYTPELAVGVWVGFDGERPVGLPGNVAALPMFADFLREALGPRGERRLSGGAGPPERVTAADRPGRGAPVSP